ATPQQQSSELRPAEALEHPHLFNRTAPSARRLDLRGPSAKADTSGLSTLIKDHLAGGASRLAALLLAQILPVFSVVAPCHPGAAREIRCTSDKDRPLVAAKTRQHETLRSTFRGLMVHGDLHQRWSRRTYRSSRIRMLRNA